MKNRTKFNRFAACPVFCLLIFLFHNACGISVKLVGFVPPSIDESAVMYEYRQIMSVLSPKPESDREPLTITFFTRNTAPPHRFSLPEWGGGGTVGTDQIVIALDRGPFLGHTVYQTMVHELVHCVLNRLCKDIALPRWFHEGCAMVLSAEPSSREHIVISKALFTASLLPLSAVDSVNTFKQIKAELAYSQSRQAVLFLVETYGLDVLKEIINETNKTGSFWKGFNEVLQYSEKEFEILYQDFIYKHQGRFLWLIDTYLLWALILLLFIVGFIVTLIRVRKKKQQLEYYENPDTAD